MFLSKGHGQQALTSQEHGGVLMGLGTAAGVTDGVSALVAPARPPQTFGYFFPDAPDLADTGMTADMLDALADTMAEVSPPADPGALNSRLPPIVTYVGQFVDHDVTAGTDADFGVASIMGKTVVPASRADVTASGVNARHGSLNLDSLYGDLREQGDFGRRLQALLRFPADRRQMWIARPTPQGGEVPLPVDGAGDLLRLGRLLKGPKPLLTLAELQALTGAEREHFLKDDQPIVQRAIIGDSRNDENLIVAQLHLAFLRLHNRLAVTCVDGPALEGGADGVFAWAQRQMRLHYQWLVVNRYLPAVCDPAVVAQVVATEAPLYRAFRRAVGAPADIFPLPVEFSAAAFRFGHSMIRAAYDHNRFFGKGDGPDHILDSAPFSLLFAFTGNGQPPMAPGAGAPSTAKLPSNWVIEWERFVVPQTDPRSPRAARKIDTHIVPPLLDMQHLTMPPADIVRHLARRNLRRGLALNIPVAQDCIAALNRDFGAGIVPLTPDELRDADHGVPTPDALIDRTPLWFYVLKEAEMRAEGQHLGPLGSHLVAQTLVGLVVEDPDSYWHAPAINGPHWQPGDDARPDGITVDDWDAMLRAALLLA